MAGENRTDGFEAGSHDCESVQFTNKHPSQKLKKYRFLEPRSLGQTISFWVIVAILFSNLIQIQLPYEDSLFSRLRITDALIIISTPLTLVLAAQNSEIRKRLRLLWPIWLAGALLGAPLILDILLNGSSAAIIVALGSLIEFLLFAALVCTVRHKAWNLLPVALLSVACLAATGTYAKVLVSASSERVGASWPFLDPNHSSTFILISILMAIALPFERNFLTRVLAGIYVVPALVILDSNTSLIASLCVALFSFFSLRRSPLLAIRRRACGVAIVSSTYIAVAVLVSGASVAVHAFSSSQIQIADQVSDTESTNQAIVGQSNSFTPSNLFSERFQGSANSRIDLYQLGIERWLENPWGQGLEQAIIEDHPYTENGETKFGNYDIHNEFITWLVSFGLFGMALLIAVSIFLFLKGNYVARVALVVWLVLMLFHNSFSWRYVWMMVAIGLANDLLFERSSNMSLKFSRHSHRWAADN